MPSFDSFNGPPRSAGRPMALKNWRVRTRLIALVLVPTIAAVVLAGLRVASSLSNAEGYARTFELTEIDLWAVDLVLALQDERDEVSRYISEGRSGATDIIDQRRATVEGLAQDYRAQVEVFNETFESDEINEQLDAIEARLSGLDQLREAALTTDLPADSAFTAYTEIIEELLDLNGQIGRDSPDQEIRQSVRALDALARAEEYAARERGLLFRAISAGQFAAGDLEELDLWNAQRQSALGDFQRNAMPDQLALYDELLGGREPDEAAREREQWIARGREAGGRTFRGGDAAADIWNSTAKAELDLLRAVERQFIEELNNRSRELQEEAQRGALVDTLIVALVLFLVFLGIALMGRSMTRPLRRLQTAAFEVAETRLPEIVRSLEQSDTQPTNVEVEPVGVVSRDEIGDLARAFDAVHAEAVRLAVEQAELRSNVNAMFVNLSRRSQGLVERQLRLIEDLENSEQNPDQLASLFRLDHLATRMRRNGENLLVLAGEEPERRWSEPVPLIDIVRAAISEVEQYERIDLTPLPDVEVAGRAVNDVVHLLAELLENATVFSSGDSSVLVDGHVLGSGGIMLQVEDRGIGMEPAELDAINERLTNPPVIDVSVSRRMGLFVVGRLAHRHGIRVRLRGGQQDGGITALVALPPELVTFTSGALPIGAQAATAPPAPPSPPEGFGVSPAGLPQRMRTELPPAAQNGAGLPPSPGPDGWPGRPLGGSRMPGLPGPPLGSRPGAAPPVRPPDDAEPFGDETEQTQVPLSGGIPQPPTPAAPLPGGRAPAPDAAPGARDRADDRGSPGSETPPPIRPSGEAPPARPPAEGAEMPVSGPIPRPPLSRGVPPTGQPPSGDETSPPVTRATGGLPLPTPPGGRPIPSPLTAAQRARAAAASVPAGDIFDPNTAASHADLQAEPIFASIQSEWFRHTPTPAAGLPRTPLPSPPPAGPPAGLEPPRLQASEPTGSRPPDRSPPPASSIGAGSGDYAVPRASPQSSVEEESWVSPGDEGWRAAASAAAPATGGFTVAGLPRRVPKANLVPGSAPPMPGSLAGQGRHAQLRSADEVRGRLSSLHRGTRRVRDAHHEEDSPLPGPSGAADTGANQSERQENA